MEAKLSFMEIIDVFVQNGINSAEAIDRCLSDMVGKDWPDVPICNWIDRLKEKEIEVSPEITFGELLNVIISNWRARQ